VRVCVAVRAEPRIETLDEGNDGMDKGEGMWALLPGERTFLGLKVADIKIRSEKDGGDDEGVQAYPWTLYRMKDGASFSRVSRGKKTKPSISKLKSDGVFLFDSGFEIFLWVGDKAPANLRGSAFPFAQQYLKVRGCVLRAPTAASRRVASSC
jgi:hypothetical protein